MDPLDILWEDPHGIAVNKPAGLLTHPGTAGSADPALDGRIRRYLRPEAPAEVYLGTVHRLDRPVSGVILWAKTSKAARRWAEQFALRQAQKTYWAIISVPAGTGDLTTNVRTEIWTDWLTSPDREGRAQVVPAGTRGAVEAITEVEWGPAATMVGRDHPRYRWLQLHPRTGRTHQLRAQTAARGGPILGDSTYGSAVPFGQGIALHARRLRIHHPIRHEPLTIEAGPPTAWDAWTAGSSELARWLSQTRFPEPEA